MALFTKRHYEELAKWMRAIGLKEQPNNNQIQVAIDRLAMFDLKPRHGI